MVFQDEERHTLIPWDAALYEIANWRTNTVHQDHRIKCLDALYSVPPHLCRPGQRVGVRLDSKLARIYHRGKLVKIHQRQPKGGRSTHPDDYPAELTAYTMKAPERIKRSAALLRPAVAEFAERLFEGDHPGRKSGRDTSCRVCATVTAPSAGPPPVSGPWTSTKSTYTAWSASWSRLWKGKPRPNCLCPSHPAVSIGPDASSTKATRTAGSRPEEIIPMTRVTELTPMLKNLILGAMAATLP